MAMTGTDREFHLRHYLRFLRKHQWLMIGVFLVTVVSVALWTFTRVPIFQATATLLIDPEAPRVVNIQDVTPTAAQGSDYYATQHELIRSRAVIDRVIETLDLRERLPALKGAQDPYRAFVGGVVVEPRRNTRLVSVKYEGPDPAFAAEAANAIAAAYVRYNLELKLKGARDALAWLNDEMAQLRTRVQDSSMALQNYRVRAGILGIEEQRRITAQKIMDFNKAHLDAQAQRLSIDAKLRELTQIASDRPGAQSIFSVADSALIQKLKSEAADLEVQKSQLLKTYKDKHPEILKIDARIQQVSQKMDAELQTMLRAVQTEYRVAKAREDTLLANVNRLRSEGQDLNEKEIQYQTLAREADSNQQLYDTLLKRFKETGITGGLETNNARIVESAVVPRVPVRPNRTFSLLAAVIVGAVLSIGTVFVLEYFDNTFKSPDEVERVLGIPVISVVPVFGRR